MTTSPPLCAHLFSFLLLCHSAADCDAPSPFPTTSHLLLPLCQWPHLTHPTLLPNTMHHLFDGTWPPTPTWKVKLHHLFDGTWPPTPTWKVKLHHLFDGTWPPTPTWKVKLHHLFDGTWPPTPTWKVKLHHLFDGTWPPTPTWKVKLHHLLLPFSCWWSPDPHSSLEGKISSSLSAILLLTDHPEGKNFIISAIWWWFTRVKVPVGLEMEEKMCRHFHFWAFPLLPTPPPSHSSHRLESPESL